MVVSVASYAESTTCIMEISQRNPPFYCLSSHSGEPWLAYDLNVSIGIPHIAVNYGYWMSIRAVKISPNSLQIRLSGLRLYPTTTRGWKLQNQARPQAATQQESMFICSILFQIHVQWEISLIPLNIQEHRSQRLQCDVIRVRGESVSGFEQRRKQDTNSIRLSESCHVNRCYYQHKAG